MKSFFQSFRRPRTIILSLVALTLSLVFVMAVHIYLVTAPKSDGFVNAQRQLSRIDLPSSLSTEKAMSIEKSIRSMPGIQNTHLNTKDNIVVFTYDIGSTTSQRIHQSVQNLLTGTPAVTTASTTNHTSQSTEAKLYTVEKTTNGSCPMSAQQTSMFRRIGHFMHSVID